MKGAPLTKAYEKIYNGVRRVTRVDPNSPVIFLDGDGETLGYTVISGWFIQNTSDGVNSDKEFLLTFTDRADFDEWIYDAEQFEIGDTLYERTGSPASPSGNPALWKVAIKPVRRREV